MWEVELGHGMGGQGSSAGALDSLEHSVQKQLHFKLGQSIDHVLNRLKGHSHPKYYRGGRALEEIAFPWRAYVPFR